MSTVVTEQSWFGRLGNAFKGIVVGLVLCVISVPVLFWNEGRAVKTAKGLKEGAGAVVKLSSADVSAENDGKFVHLTGSVATEDILRDEEFGIEFNGIRLRRKAEMYQWVEKRTSKEKTKLGGGTRTETRFSYRQEWKDQRVNSSGFHDENGHQNPTEFMFQNETQQAGDVALGGFKLPSSLVNQISGSKPLEIDPERVGDDIAGSIVVKNEGKGSVAYWRAMGQYDGTPQIGDMRISFSATPVSDVSVMSKQIKETFEPYQTQYGTELNMLQMGTLSSESMIATAEAANTQLTWILRAVGAGMMFFGLLFVLKPLSVLADVVPLFGSVVGAGAGIIAFLLAAAGSLITIAVAWIFYRPVLGVGLIAIAAALLFFVFTKTRKSRYAAEEMGPAEVVS